MKPYKLLIKYLLKFPLPERDAACHGMYLKARRLSDLFYRIAGFFMSWSWILAAVEGAIFGCSIRSWTSEDKLVGLASNALAVLLVYALVARLLFFGRPQDERGGFLSVLVLGIHKGNAVFRIST
jgi:hypothetical protein